MSKLTNYAEHNLKREIDAIRKSNRKKELPQLSDHEKAVIFKYSSSNGYRDVNTTLRKSKGKSLTELGVYLKSSLNKLENFEGLVYRGVNLNKATIDKYSKALKNNEPLKEFSFLSTSKSRAVARAFAGNVLFRIFSKTGKDIENISEYGKHGYPNELEVLFLPNRKFRILEIRTELSYTLITMEELV